MIKKEPFEEKMKNYCELKNSDIFGAKVIIKTIENSNPNLKNYYELLGSLKIKSLNYKESKLKRELRNKNNYYLCKEYLSERINPNEFISAVNAKKIVSEAYFINDISATAKGSDLSKWYDLKPQTIRINGKNTKGYLIIQ